MNKSTLVISAFPACGKSYATEHYKDKYSILDSDSSQFSWTYRQRTEEELEEIKKILRSPLKIGGRVYAKRMDLEACAHRIKNDFIRVRNPEFPQNYIQHIKENIGKVDIIFVSSHLNVRESMGNAGIEYITIYPENTMLDEWIGRMYRRGNNEEFINFIIDKWDDFMNDVEHEPHGRTLYRLTHNQYIDEELLENIGKQVTR